MGDREGLPRQPLLFLFIREDMSTLSGKTVFVTGASSGIGRATALAFAREGCRLLVCARRQERLEAVEQELTAAGAVAGHRFTLDVTDRGAGEAELAGAP